MVDLPAGRQGGFLYNVNVEYFVYIIQSQKDGSFYKGLTNNLSNRIRQHNAGNNLSTKSKRPYKLIYFERYNNRIEARKREKYWKSGVGRDNIDKLIHSPVAQW